MSTINTNVLLTRMKQRMLALNYPTFFTLGSHLYKLTCNSVYTSEPTLCAMYGPVSYEYMNTWYKSIAQVNEAKALCHVLVWAILIMWAIISAVVVSLYRCCVRDEYDTKLPTQTV